MEYEATLQEDQEAAPDLATVCIDLTQLDTNDNVEAGFSQTSGTLSVVQQRNFEGTVAVCFNPRPLILCLL